MSGEAETLPLAHVKRVVRSKLAEVAGEGGAGGGADKAKKEVTVQKEALAALAEAGRMFIHYLTGTANELCQESKRLTINADDVLRALDEIEFSEFAEPLRETLTAFKAAHAEKQANKDRKRKAEGGTGGEDTQPPKVLAGDASLLGGELEVPPDLFGRDDDDGVDA